MRITKRRVLERATFMGLDTHVSQLGGSMHYYFQRGAFSTPVAVSTAEAYAMLDGIEFGNACARRGVPPAPYLIRKKRIGRTRAVVYTFSNELDVLFSYGIPVAVRVPGRGYLRTKARYGRTTTRHLNSWCPRNAELVEQREIDELIVSNRMEGF